MDKPNWQLKFQHLPEIPEHKLWRDGKNLTLEQELSFKLTHQKLTPEEETIFVGLTNFYSQLYDGLTTLKYEEFSHDDFENFKNYIGYAFNYTIFRANAVTIFHLYRLVLNDSVNEGKRITTVDKISFPSKELIKERGIYNRANSPNSNVFYASENIDSAIRECRIYPNQLVTVGLWKPKRDSSFKAKKFVSYPIGENEEAAKVNEGVKAATDAINQVESKLLADFVKNYLKVLSREYTKPINHKYEYFLSSWFSERILEPSRFQSDHNFDCIIYPSVQNSFHTTNFAFKPSVIESDFYLAKVIEFQIEEIIDVKEYVNHHPEKITLAKVKNIHQTTLIDNQKGKIYWDEGESKNDKI